MVNCLRLATLLGWILEEEKQIGYVVYGRQQQQELPLLEQLLPLNMIARLLVSLIKFSVTGSHLLARWSDQGCGKNHINHW